ncbi:BZ3501_MvSof-1269-A2-R1_Chr10-2g02403 [Microbotryum saponariae]|nr:BZ3501_MvSof-1269-A2-R1_Chr10-2g02403 [Microbotryum saponariae]
MSTPAAKLGDFLRVLIVRITACTAINTRRIFIFFNFTGAHKLQSFGLAGTATKRAKRGYKVTTASNWVKVKPLRAKSAAQIKTRRAPNMDSNGW